MPGTAKEMRKSAFADRLGSALACQEVQGSSFSEKNRHEAKILRLVSLSPSFSTKKLHPANYSVGLIDDKHGLMLSSKGGSTHQRTRGTRVEAGPIERKG